MTSADRYAQIEALRTSLEPAHEKRVRRALIRQGERALVAYQAGASPELAAAYVKADELTEVLTRLYQEVGVTFARQDYDALTEQYAKAQGQAYETKAEAPTEVVTSWLGRLRQFITRGEASKRIKDMVDTTRKLVTQTLQEVAQEGLSIPAGVKRLRERVAELAPSRAISIVRTEIVSASAYGSLMGAKATGLKLDKLWISTKDGRTRSSHAVANGQAVPLDSTFTIGGFPAKFPGDPMLPPSESIRCRCAIGYKPIH
ncbi:phage minor head protein [Hymenobacter sp. BT491]|uniref:phage minor head protein n=1 Tax=Hymenobacter sp. BT491 TaxID=2766779 RepID=UPI001653844A|nr:phage minor head protein [Hymenobacter sp. BT491]MBC6988946.1 hypothetical protein [Hymenobacter sp. BT491]